VFPVLLICIFISGYIYTLTEPSDGVFATIDMIVSWIGLSAISPFIVKLVKESTIKKYKETYDKKNSWT
jgi:hypothetical protein